MAEYVRRRRPPADHPYWDRLHDRAHPPRIWRPLLVPIVIGLASGLFGGLKAPFSIADATKLAALIAGAIGGLTFIVMTIAMLIDATRQLDRRQRWPLAIMGGTLTCMAMFFASFVPLALVFIAYSLSSGEGPWLGMLIGVACWSPLFIAIVYVRRARWLERQRHWPRWERMRPPRRSASQNVEVVVQVEQSATAEQATVVEKTLVVESSPENPDPQVGESNGRS
jgi:hypothetical protein